MHSLEMVIDKNITNMCVTPTGEPEAKGNKLKKKKKFTL